MKNNIKKKLDSGKTVAGTFYELGSVSAIECMGIAGLDFVIIDAEHGPFEVESTMDFVRAAELRNLTPFVRVKEISRSAVLKMLDIGAKGLIVPCVETAEQVKELVQYSKYYPLGNRGFFFGRSAGYGYDDFAQNTQSYFETCNRETMLIPQCETATCLQQIEEITGIEGVDGIFIGPYDLSIAIGKPANFDDVEFKSAIKRILQACEAAKKPAFIYAKDEKTAKHYYDMGFSGVAIGTDTGLLVESIKTMLSKLGEL